MLQIISIRIHRQPACFAVLLLLLILVGCAFRGESAFAQLDSSDDRSIHEVEISDPGVLGDSPLASIFPVVSTDVDDAVDNTIVSPPSNKLSKPVDSLWQSVPARMQHGDFAIDLDNTEVKQQLNWLLKNNRYIYRVTRRSEPYAYHIQQVIVQRNLPMELLLVPMVESAFDGFAYSPGRAAGLWQFIPSTGKHFGLQQNWWYDGRRDVVAATDAALRYFEQLHQRFGDWKLALAAYNAGPARIASAIRANKKRGLATDYWSLKLPDETRQYVPRLIALRHVFQQQQTLGIDVYPVANSPFFAVQDTGGQLDLAQAAELAAVGIEQIYRLNPGISRWATPPKGPHRLLVPVQAAEQFSSALAGIEDSQRIHWQRYRVRSGDTLSGIAARYNTSAAFIKDANAMSNNQIVAGKTLLIPIAKKEGEYYALSDRQRQRQLVAANGNKQKYEHVIAAGDSLWRVAKQHQVSVSALAKWNGISPLDTLRVGKTLVVWKAQDDARSVTRNIVYQVKKGDNLSTIAQRFNVNVVDLKRWNANKINRYLQPGQKLKIEVALASSL